MVVGAGSTQRQSGADMDQYLATASPPPEGYDPVAWQQWSAEVTDDAVRADSPVEHGIAAGAHMAAAENLRYLTAVITGDEVRMMRSMYFLHLSAAAAHAAAHVPTDQKAKR